jgi:hypothetical protein
LVILPEGKLRNIVSNLTDGYSDHYKGTNRALPAIARELGVDVVVEGAVERSGDQVRITVQLKPASLKAVSKINGNEVLRVEFRPSLTPIRSERMSQADR